MAPRARSSSPSLESEDEGAPEAVSLSQSKKVVQRLESERRNAEAVGRKAQKKKNRDLDRKLKERSEKNKEPGSSGLSKERPKSSVRDQGASVSDEEGADDLEARMERAMREAQEEEEDEEGLSSDEDGSLDSQEEGINNDEDSSDSEDSSKEDDDVDFLSPDEEDEDGENGFLALHKKAQKLPDELFTAAFSASNTSNPKRKAVDEEAPSKPAKKRKAKARRDVIIGSRAIRVLPDSNTPTVPATIPSRKIKKFLDRTLALKGGKQNLRSKGWERRPANIGVLRREGPAASFVRSV